MKELGDMQVTAYAACKELDAAARAGLKERYLSEGDAEATFKLARDLATSVRALVPVLEADARARWAVRVLDGWAARDVIMREPYATRRIADEWLCGSDHSGIVRRGPTPDAARTAAAEALVAADPSLTVGL